MLEIKAWLLARPRGLGGPSLVWAGLVAPKKGKILAANSQVF